MRSIRHAIGGRARTIADLVKESRGIDPQDVTVEVEMLDSGSGGDYGPGFEKLLSQLLKLQRVWACRASVCTIRGLVII